MAINERAKNHYDNACVWLQDAEQCLKDGEINQAIVCTGLGELAVKLAAFCVDNHVLVAGLDVDEPVDPRHPPGMGGPKVWGASTGPPLPAHTLSGEVGA